MTDQINLKTYCFKIMPTYAVHYAKRKKKSYFSKIEEKHTSKTKTVKQQKNEENLKENAHKGKLSPKATNRLKNAISWLILQAKPKTIRNSKTKKTFRYRVGMITLTLPFTQGDMPDKYIKNELLNPFFQILKFRYDFKTYVWKAEAQKNGNIHFHIITDCYIPHEDIRFLWNRLIRKKGLMKEYTEKYSQMTESEYIANEFKNGETSIKKAIEKFQRGKSENWENPNSTDVHSAKGVRNLSAYLASYMSKKEDGKRPINGKIWGTSQNLSEKNKCIIEALEGEDQEIDKSLREISTKTKLIMSEPDNAGNSFYICTLYFYNPWKVISKSISQVKDKMKDFILSIRNYESSLSPQLI